MRKLNGHPPKSPEVLGAEKDLCDLCFWPAQLVDDAHREQETTKSELLSAEKNLSELRQLVEDGPLLTARRDVDATGACVQLGDHGAEDETLVSLIYTETFSRCMADKYSVWLWHGTKSGLVADIAMDWMDPRVGRDNGRYGSGAYFACCVCKSLQYI